MTTQDFRQAFKYNKNITDFIRKILWCIKNWDFNKSGTVMNIVLRSISSCSSSVQHVFHSQSTNTIQIFQYPTVSYTSVIVFHYISHSISIKLQFHSNLNLVSLRNHIKIRKKKKQAHTHTRIVEKIQIHEIIIEIRPKSRFSRLDASDVFYVHADFDRWENQKYIYKQMRKRKLDEIYHLLYSTVSYQLRQVWINDNIRALVDEIQCTLIALILFGRFSLALSPMLKSEFLRRKCSCKRYARLALGGHATCWAVILFFICARIIWSVSFFQHCFSVSLFPKQNPLGFIMLQANSDANQWMQT